MSTAAQGRVAGKVVLVTGGGSGIGRATSIALAREGATVIVTDLDVAGGEATVRTIGAAASFLPQDTAKSADWVRVIEQIQAKHGRLQGLVNNAGILGTYPSSFENEDLESWRKVQSINMDGVFLGCKHAVPAIRDAGGGAIVNLSSIAGLGGTPELSAYGASKGAVRQFTKTVAVYCARRGYKVRCNSVHPGIIMTPMAEKLFKNEEARRRSLERIPLGEFGQPEDIAAGILYLISDEARHVTGAELVIDGGIKAA